jgi:hypothetical protein
VGRLESKNRLKNILFILDFFNIFRILKNSIFTLSAARQNRFGLILDLPLCENVQKVQK